MIMAYVEQLDLLLVLLLVQVQRVEAVAVVVVAVDLLVSGLYAQVHRLQSGSLP
jgi:hypothetical protein